MTTSDDGRSLHASTTVDGTDDVELLRAEIRRLRADLLRERARTQRLRIRTVSAEENAAMSAEQARQLRQSTSWRITAPLRRLSRQTSANAPS